MFALIPAKLVLSHGIIGPASPLVSALNASGELLMVILPKITDVLSLFIAIHRSTRPGIPAPVFGRLPIGRTLPVFHGQATPKLIAMQAFEPVK
jgi:hypothetical protein